MKNPVVHLEIAAGDAARLREFYANVFDWSIDAGNPLNHGIVDTDARRDVRSGEALRAAFDF